MQKRSPLLVLMALIFSSVLYAGNTGKIAGRVIDKESKEPLIGVNIVLVGTQYGTTTDQNGNYFILNIPVGTHEIRASYIGYAPVTTRNVRVSPDLTTELNFELPSQSIQIEPVVVTAERPLIQKDATSTISVMEATEIQALPVNTFQQAMVLAPGFVQSTRGNDQGIHLRGGRTSELTYVIDGFRVDNALYGGLALDPTRVGVASLEVLSGTFNAEYGQAQSGVINIVTQEGTGHYTGMVRGATDQFGGVKNNYNTFRTEVSLSGPMLPSLGRSATFFLSADRLFTRGYLNRSKGPIYLSPGKKVVQSDFDFGLFTNRTRGTGKLTFTPFEAVKVNLGANVNSQKQKSYDHYFKQLPEFNGIDANNNQLYTLNVNHALSRSAFYEVKASYFTVKNQHYLYEEQLSGDFSRIFAPFSSAVAFDSTSNYEFAGPYSIGLKLDDILRFGYALSEDLRSVKGDTLILKAGTVLTPQMVSLLKNRGVTTAKVNAPSMDNFFQDYKTSTLTLAGSFTSQLDKWNLVKVGFEFKQHTITNNILPDVNGNWDHVDDSFPVFKRHGNETHYTFKPIQLAAFVQDKLEISDLIINVGLRLDYLDPKAPDVYSVIENPADPNLRTKDVKPKYHMGPRIGFAHPITDRAKIHFAYGSFFEYPDFDKLYRRFYQNNPLVQYPLPDLAQQLSPFIGNPNLKPERTIAYEIGGELMLSDNLVGSVNVFYKDTYDYVSTKLVEVRGANYTQFENFDYANSRGLEISLRRRLSHNLGFAVNYTYSRAEGNADYWATHFDEFYNASVLGLIAAKKNVTLAWDQPHTLNFNINLTYEGWGAAFIGSFGSGFPYTPSDERGKPIGETNSDRLPWTSTVDLRAYKTFNLEMAKVTLFTDITNLFNKINIRNVFRDSGQPDNGLNPNLSAENKHRPHYYGPGRHIEVGLELGF